MFKTYAFLTLSLLLVTGTANAQKRAIGYSPPGPLGPIDTGPDTEPPTINITKTAGVAPQGEELRGVKTLPLQNRVAIWGEVMDNQQAASLRIGNQDVPLTGGVSRKSFGIILPSPNVGRARDYEFVATDKAGNQFRQIYRISRTSASTSPVLALLESESEPVSSPQIAEDEPVLPPPPPPSAPPKIRLFAIGISKFRDSTLNLDYAASDANSFYQFFRSAKGARLPKTQATLLTDEAATRAKVMQSLTRTLKIASEKDLVIIFIATHGLPDYDTGEINFLMHDTDMNNLVATGLSHTDLNRVIERSRAKKILFIVDACHSGQLGSGRLLAQRGITFSEVNRLLSMLAQASDGVAMLTASSANEASFEDERWNGGVFTYYLLGALSGKADTNKDQIVTLREAFDYLYNTVPAATGGRQHPELTGKYSNELPLVEVNP